MTQRPELERLRGRLEQKRALPSPQQRRSIRVAAGVTCEDIGQALGVTRQTVAAWETGIRAPGREHVDAYLEVLRLLALEAS